MGDSSGWKSVIYPKKFFSQIKLNHSKMNRFIYSGAQNKTIAEKEEWAKRRIVTNRV